MIALEHSKLRISTFKRKDSGIHLVVFVVLFAYLCVLLITYYLGGNGGGLPFLPGSRGIVFNLEKNSYNFKISGFEYYPKYPPIRNPKLKTSNVWLLRAFKNGTITMKDIYKHASKASQVSVMIKYFIAAPTHSKFSVAGTSPKLMEQVTFELSQYGQDYCTRIMFFGLVDEIKVEALVEVNGGYILIDNMIIGVGYFSFDGLDEESCS